MRLFRFDSAVGRAIDHFDSSGMRIVPVVRAGAPAHVGCIYLAPGGVVGHHPAATAQLFLVVQGAGWVRGPEPARQAIGVGLAAFWERDEWHSAGTDSGMVAIVIEAEGLDPTAYLPAA